MIDVFAIGTIVTASGSRSTMMQIQYLRIVKLKFINGLRVAIDRLPRQIATVTVAGSSLYLTLGLGSTVRAQSSLIPPTAEVCEIDLAALKSSEPGTNPNIVTADTASPQGMTLPSLWWPNEQFASKKLVTNWIANRAQKQIYLLVGTQSWHLLDYIDRYRTIDRFGRVAQSYGYNLKICDSQKIALARYTCDLSLAPSPTQAAATAGNTPTNCQIWLNSNDQNGMSVQTTSPLSR
jgi:hypothetical protein